MMIVRLSGHPLVQDSLSKKDQSSRPNQTDNLKRLAKINSTYHRRESNMTQVQSVEVFCGVTSHHYQAFTRIVFIVPPQRV